MRIIGEIRHPECKITVMDWNQKYLVKFEQGPFEQTFKIEHHNFQNFQDLQNRINESFIRKVLARFNSMQDDLNQLMEFMEFME